MTVQEAGRGKAGKAKKKRLSARKPVRASTSYLALARELPIRPLRSDEELDAAIAMVDRLLSRRKPLDEQEQGYLDSLSHEIERYEALAYPMPNVSAEAMLRHLIEAKGVTLSQAAADTGIALSTISAVLSGKRKLNRNHIETLAPYFGVEPGAFLG
jgi:HTH-type transcriptional regulator / antitoxin HigA